MNANEITPKANVRLYRIKIASRIAKWNVFVFFLFAVCFLFFLIPSSALHFKLLWFLSFIYQIVLCVWYWKLAQLFRLYERGQIFAAETIRSIKKLGLICVVGAIFKSAIHFFPKPQFPSPQTSLPPGVTITTTTFHTFQIGFFSFDFGTGVDFGLILTGIGIVLIAWIMDEGRKIQEEQELTV
ncbi:MAG TPA: DUF2975 domain-containing protein [Verrucomicrobiae bacterium]|jgi:hypothetical protein